MIDNGSTDGTQEYLKELQEKGKIKEVIFNQENRGIPESSNQFLEIIGNKYTHIGKVDNDIVFKSNGWLEIMVKIWQRNNCMILSPYVEGLINNPGGVLRDGYGLLAGELLGLVRHLGGCSVFGTYLAYKGWKWPIQAKKHGGNDVLFSIHCREEGFQMAYVENHRVGHYTGLHKELYPEYFGSIRQKEQKEVYANSNT